MKVRCLLLSISLFACEAYASLRTQTFVSPDGVFRFAYPQTYLLKTEENADNLGASYIPVCDERSTCVVTRRDAYQGTNFQAASFEVRQITDATTRDACLKGPPSDVPRSDVSKSDEHRTIGGVVFTHGKTAEVGAGNQMGSDFYRTFHRGKCYELSVSIAISSFANFDPGKTKEFTREDEQRVHQDLMTIVDSFRFLK